MPHPNADAADQRKSGSKPGLNAQGVPLEVWAVGGFALALIALGGSSRPDAMQNAFLRPLACWLLAVSLLWWRPVSLGRLKPLLLWLLGLAIIMMVQLIPLPTWFWENPVRASVVELDDLILGERVWRPISLVPGRTLNAMFGLIIPCVALVIAVRHFSTKYQMLAVIATIVTFDALLGICQVIMGRSSALYFYAKTNLGAPVGVFANENHSAVFSAMGVVVFAKLALLCSRNRRQRWLLVCIGLGASLALLSILVSGSRSGFALGGFAVVASAVAYFLQLGPARGYTASSSAVTGQRRVQLAIAVLIASAFLLMAVAFVLSDRSPAYAQIFGRDGFTDLRWKLGPVFLRMIADFWLTGSGFGSFEEVYHFYEPTELLLPNYVNQAHNDWAQVAIEGGLAAVAMLLAFIVWLVRLAVQKMKSGEISSASATLWCAILVVIAAASFVDYPLRTPIFQAVIAWLVAALLLEGPEEIGKENRFIRVKGQ